MVVFPHCKINLGLRILKKREDGYHDIDTCFYPVPLSDILEVIPSADFSFTSSGHAVPGDPHDNLCVKGFELLRSRFGIGNVKIHLHKVIPMGAGLGGGSSDGAFTLRLLNEVFALNLSSVELKGFAAQLGSDCAFFIEDRPQFGRGKGNVLEAATVDLQKKFLVVVKPPVHVATAEAYRGVKPAMPEENLEAILKLPVNEWRGRVSNDFEKSIFEKYPRVASVKKIFDDNGALFSSMSGSGSSVFAIFHSSVDLREHFPAEYFYWSSFLSQ